jgi:hypothetical protein
MTGDEALKMALIAHYEEYYSQYDVTADDKPHRFSLAYRIRKNSIIRLAKKRWERPAPCVPCKPSAGQQHLLFSSQKYGKQNLGVKRGFEHHSLFA